MIPNDHLAHPKPLERVRKEDRKRERKRGSWKFELPICGEVNPDLFFSLFLFIYKAYSSYDLW
jgi:hypothetical protein